ncbi:Uncharacterized protein FWK35_00016288 [Aphis craccivora]|uniref:Uncharacterized protein n=1 Tax=Aphis craccivora TaxID=307492 RepID=A0A6G0XH77_APHCR|nr:Uncharacterized protein FWK35_00016288 [Aphis craccivora]
MKLKINENLCYNKDTFCCEYCERHLIFNSFFLLLTRNLTYYSLYSLAFRIVGNTDLVDLITIYRTLLFCFPLIVCAILLFILDLPKYQSSLTWTDERDLLASLEFPINSERSEECIDFTMIITSRNNAPISNFGGGFRCKSEYPWCIIEVKS